MPQKQRLYTFEHREVVQERHVSELQSEVIAFLYQHRGPRAIASLEKKLHFPIASNSELVQFLSNNPKVAFNTADNTLTYTPTYPQIKDKQSLLEFAETNSKTHSLFPLSLRDLLDAYEGVLEDAESLVAENFLYRIDDAETGSTVFLYKDPQFNLDVDEDIKEKWRGVSVVSDIAMETALVDAGMMSLAEHEAGHQLRKRKSKVAVNKKGRKSARVRKDRKYVITNTHMVDELGWLKESGKMSK